jgi:hypothetical protein
VAERVANPKLFLRMGCIDTKIPNQARAHIWRSDAASWFDLKDAIPEYAEGLP